MSTRRPSACSPRARGRDGSASAGAASRPSRSSTPPEPTLTIADVDAAFEALATASGPGSAAARSATLQALAAQATGAEWDFLARVIVGELRTGALEGVLLDAIVRASGREAASVRRAAMLSGDLAETAALAITGTAEALDAVGLVVGRAIMPMLAGTAPSAAEAIATVGEASVEYKLDGARIQVHRAGDDVWVFTRNLADITHRLPEVVEIVRRMPVHAVILDGETLALDENDVPRPFQDTMAGSARRGRDARPVLHPWFFDVLHLDGRDLIDEPLALRRAELGRIAPAHLIPGEITADPAAAEQVSAAALAAGHEGVVVKAIDSTVCGRSPRGELDQGEAGAHVRPRRPRRGVGVRAAHRDAVQPAPRRPR